MFSNKSDNAQFPNRKSPRAKWANYEEGKYFITVCTKDMKEYLGDISDGVMSLSDVGNCLNNELANVSRHQPYCIITQYVIMPNHFHMILMVEHSDQETKKKHCNTTVSQVINHIKGTVTRYAKSNGIEFKWKERFHDHIIRNEKENKLITEYIIGNVANWKLDCLFH